MGTRIDADNSNVGEKGDRRNCKAGYAIFFFIPD